MIIRDIYVSDYVITLWYIMYIALFHLLRKSLGFFSRYNNGKLHVNPNCRHSILKKILYPKYLYQNPTKS